MKNKRKRLKTTTSIKAREGKGTTLVICFFYMDSNINSNK